MDDTDLTNGAAHAEELFSDAFMREHTEFESWDVFKRLLAATPRNERDMFVKNTTHFSCFREMEAMALAVVERGERALPRRERPRGVGPAQSVSTSSR
jgi:Lon protease-like protein